MTRPPPGMARAGRVPAPQGPPQGGDAPRTAGHPGPRRRARLGLLLVAALSIPGPLAAGAASEPAAGQASSSTGAASRSETGTTASSSAYAAGGPAAGPASSSSVYRAAASFADLDYPVLFYGRVWLDHPSELPDSPAASAGRTTNYFGEVAMVERAGSGLELSFAVEDQSESPQYQACYSAQQCEDVTVRVTPGGLLYLHAPMQERRFHSHLGGFPQRAVELSASDADTGLKVYREVTVGPPAAAAGCEDYRDRTPEMFTCLFLREVLPADATAHTDEEVERLRAGLPGLVQDSANYRLVFAEEFDGSPAAPDENGCRDGLSTLDHRIWNYGNACDNVDSKGDPCHNVAGGAYTMGVASACSSSLNTFSKLYVKYGYLETKYTINRDRWPSYLNHNLVLYAGGNPFRRHRDRYGLQIQGWEDWLKTNGIEIDIFEYIGDLEVSHQYADWGFLDGDLGVNPIRSNKALLHCEFHTVWLRPIVVPGECGPSSRTYTVTRGIEWTPRGYRSFIRVHGYHEDLTVWPEHNTTVHYVYERVKDGVTERAHEYLWSAHEKAPYFEFLKRRNPDSVLEQVAVSHVPHPIAMSAWGYPEPSESYVRTRTRLDYIRIWQPENLYTDMEPVYQ